MGKKIPMWQILICVVFTLGIIMYSIFLSYGEAHMPLILSSALVCIVAALNGWKWSVMEKGIWASPYDRKMEYIMIPSVNTTQIRICHIGIFLPIIDFVRDKSCTSPFSD